MSRLIIKIQDDFTITELKEKYKYIQKYLIKSGADNQYLDCLDEIFELAKINSKTKTIGNLKQGDKE